jgi:hypothetical protein
VVSKRGGAAANAWDTHSGGARVATLRADPHAYLEAGARDGNMRLVVLENEQYLVPGWVPHGVVGENRFTGARPIELRVR